MSKRSYKFFFYLAGILPILGYAIGREADLHIVLRWIIVVLVGLIPFMIGHMALYWHRISVQKDRDINAEIILEGITAGDIIPSFSLYLRPFSVTNECWVKTKHKGELIYRAPDEEKISDIELQVSEALDSIAPIIGLGVRGEIGVGRIESNEKSWKSNITVLATNASMILLLPFTSEGVKWEIDLLLSNTLLNKTIFLMPPDSRYIDPKREWEKATELYSNFGLKLPVYNSDGVLFMLNSSGNEVSKKITIKHPVSVETLQDAFRKLLSHCKA
jgi:hypothetical protein